MSPAEELRAAVAALRENRQAWPDMPMIPIVLREPLAAWLDWAAQMQADGEYVASRLGCEPDPGRYMGLDLALAMARTINAPLPPSS